MSADANDATVGVGIVGCGNIAGRYVQDLGRQPHLRLVGMIDADPARAEALASEHAVRAYATLDDMLADAEIGAVLNLTSWRAHLAVSRRALEAGRHVFSEKPLATTAGHARELVGLADRMGVLLAAAPIAGIGELAQTARRWVEDGRLGTVRLAYAEANWGRIESWHPDPEPFYAIGPLHDVGIYPITLATGLLGPVARVRADARRLLAERVARDGRRFEIEAPDHVVAWLEHDRGAVTRLTASFYVVDPARQRGIELHGDAGSLWLSNWFQFAGTLEHAPSGQPYRPVPLLREPAVPMPWAAGLEELAVAAAERRAPRGIAADHAAHVIDVIETALRAAGDGRERDVASRFDPPPPMHWAASLSLAEPA